MPPSEKPRQFQKVSCLCGADVKVDVLSGERRVTCRACNSNFDFVVTLDAARRNSRVSLILPKGALGLPAPAPSPSLSSSPATPPPPPKTPTRVAKMPAGKTIKAILGTCECGEHFPLVDDGELASIQSCPHCGRLYHVAFRVDSATKIKTPMIAPIRDQRRSKTVPGTKKPKP